MSDRNPLILDSGDFAELTGSDRIKIPGDSLQTAGSQQEGPLAQTNDFMVDFVVQGFLTPAGSGLSGTMSTANVPNSATNYAIAYTKGQRIYKASGDADLTFTYTASRDTYDDLAADGTITHVAVANGAGEPAITANSIRLQKVVTDGSDITSVTQLAATEPGLKGVGSSITYRSFPTSGSVAQGLYYHAGDWTSTGGLTIASGVRVVVTGTMTFNHFVQVSLGTEGGGAGSAGGHAVAAHGAGPGGGRGGLTPISGGGGGGGGGGRGGIGGGNSLGRHPYGGRLYTVSEFFAGSGGGGGSSNTGGTQTGGEGGGGGGGIHIECLQDIIFNDSLDASGSAGVTGGTGAGSGGGGGGGCIDLRASNSILIAASEFVRALGGAGGGASTGGEPGGGGGGGFIRLWAPTITINGSTSVSAGSAGGGGSGTQPPAAGNSGVLQSITGSPIFDLVKSPKGPQGDQGPQGDPGEAYVHTQASPASTWTINHNLGFYPSVSVRNSGNVEVEATVSHSSVNQTVVEFVSSISGSARLT